MVKIDKNIFFVEKTSSTMNEARTLIKRDCESFAAVYAGVQTEGRGRFENRRWEAGELENLTTSIIIRESDFNISANLIPIMVAFSLSKFISTIISDSHIKIKWPNDILIDHKKISGIIIERFKDYYIIGIGLNLNKINFSNKWNNLGTSLYLQTGKMFSPYYILKKYLKFLRETIIDSSDKDIIEYVRARLFGIGKIYTIELGTPKKKNRISGKIMDISDFGELRLLTKRGIKNISSAEIIL